MPEPFFLLYVLVVSRTDDEVGRYQSEPLDRHALQSFLKDREAFLENDARHNLWIRSAADGSMLVYDRHNVTYAYGDSERWRTKLDREGLTEVSQVRFPDPHSHHYHSEFDQEERRTLQERPWMLSPLRPGDENPT